MGRGREEEFHIASFFFLAMLALVIISTEDNEYQTHHPRDKL